MTFQSRKKSLSQLNSRTILKKKITLTVCALLFYRIGTLLPLQNIDQNAFTKAFSQLETQSSLMQVFSLYSSTRNRVSFFSLGIIPFINASIIVDLLTTMVPTLEQLQSEEGEFGRKKLYFYKKCLTIAIAILQSCLAISYLKPYIYQIDFFSCFILIIQFVSGTLVQTWLCNIIDTKGIGNGTSLIIFANIVISFFSKINLSNINLTLFFAGQFGLILFLIGFIAYTQQLKIDIPVTSARQLVYLNNFITRKRILNSLPETSMDTGLSIRLTQAGIFPIIIASNVMPLISILENKIGIKNNMMMEQAIYFSLLIASNYLYTIIFWDPQKIGEQLRKGSVSIADIPPGKETIDFLNKCVTSTSILGGVILCLIICISDLMKKLPNSYLLNQINIPSLMIVVGVCYELQKVVKGYTTIPVRN